MAEPVGWRVVVEVAPESVELVSDRLFQLGALGIEEREAAYDSVLLLAGMEDETSARRASTEVDGASVHPIVDDGWADAWHEWARPVKVGDVVVVPAWQAPGDDSDGLTVVEIDPVRTFGSGAHETTQLALGALLELDAIGRMLDMGCGSGVLAVVAAMTRGARVTAIDVDPSAVGVTHANAERNGVRSLVDASTTPLADIDGSFDVVVANVLAVTLRELAPDLARVVAGDGVLIASGMLRDQADGVDAELTAEGLRVVGRRDDGEWSARIYERSEPR